MLFSLEVRCDAKEVKRKDKRIKGNLAYIEHSRNVSEIFYVTNFAKTRLINVLTNNNKL